MVRIFHYLKEAMLQEKVLLMAKMLQRMLGILMRKLKVLDTFLTLQTEAMPVQVLKQFLKKMEET